MTVGIGTVVVVGAGGAMGRVVAAAIDEAGGHSVGFDRISSESVIECDATDFESFNRTLRAHVDLEKVSGLVNLAGIFEVVDFIESRPEQWSAMIRANLLTTIVTSRVVVPSLRERGDGSIVNIASTAGEYGSIQPSAAYAAAKGGVIAFTKSLAREVSPYGVRVNAVSPGPVGTAMLEATPAYDTAASRTLLGRLGTPNDIASAVLFLLGEDSAWITGEVLRVNGGSLL